MPSKDAAPAADTVRNRSGRETDKPEDDDLARPTMANSTAHHHPMMRHYGPAAGSSEAKVLAPGGTRAPL